MIVKLKTIKDERIDVVIFDFLNLSVFLNGNYYVNIPLQSKKKVVRMEESDSDML